MRKWEKYALVGSLIKNLRAQGSWCGETHLQKAAYISKYLLGVPFDEEFTLYKYGPFSFDLRDCLGTMRAESLISLVAKDKYGATYEPTPLLAVVEELFGESARKYSRHFAFVADLFGSKGVVELERLSTALYVTKELPDSSKARRAERLIELKPHITRDNALKAVEDIDSAMAAARSFS